MNRHVNAISGRLSLRPPQRASLEILDRVTEIISLDKEPDLALALDVIRSEFQSVTDFEREFPSLCFALATGVGKTRLMGAFIAYLFLAHGKRNFFVLAPNLTIYSKLIADFTPNTPKYVFEGIGEFAASPPEIITGDNYESGRGIRGATLSLYDADGVQINIFNISKINTEVRGGKSPRIKRLSEYIGESYFEYLAGLNDLVLLMDESHRYRASAGVRAINELRPILGLELTATPQIEASTGPVPFKNVIYSYPLASALADGFVKEPAVATRENFNAANYTPNELDQLKLEDGVRIHESIKVDLEVYARQNDRPLVKPFMLVVAKDTEHANELVATIKEDAFFDGRYKDRVITVHSNQRGDERDETVERLLSVEDPANPTEIVVHVNMLKEGWDVTNLYTIVPLRTASSRTLVEQSIGRGLRLPYGQRVGVAAVDRLTIVAHDRFQEIVDEANKPTSIIRTGLIIGRDIAVQRREAIVVPSQVEAALDLARSSLATNDNQPALPFANATEQQIAIATYEVIKRYERLPRSADLRSPEIQARIVREVKAEYIPQGVLIPDEGVASIEETVARTTDFFVERTIDIPRIVVQPVGDMTAGFRDFDLDLSGIHPQPVAKNILIQHLRTNKREGLLVDGDPTAEERPENYLVRALIDFDDISYDEHADLLYKLAGQAVAHLRSYLPDEDAVRNVLVSSQRQLAELIHTQMQPHYQETATGYEAHATRGFTTLRANTYAIAEGEQVRYFREPVEKPQEIGGMVFGGFRRCLYPQQKFQSNPERRFAVVLEDDEAVLKWLKPAPRQFQLYYGHNIPYEPDFVVETVAAKLLCEPKRADQIKTTEVQDKARAATEWCRHATRHELANGGKPWSYLLIPHDRITASATLKALVAEFAVQDA